MRRAPWVTGAIFLGLLVASIWLLRRPETPPPAPFFALKRLSPDTLAVATAGDTTVMIPGGEGWTVISPVTYPADGVVVEAMVKRLDSLEVDARYPITRDKLDTYGFRFPRGLIRASYRGGLLPDSLWIGALTPDGRWNYVRAGSVPTAGLVDARVSRTYLLKTTTELRDTELLPFSDTAARTMRLLGPGKEVRVELEKSARGVWNLVLPYPGPASPKKVGEYLDSASHMHIRSFVREGPGPLAPYGLADPRLGIRVTVEGGKEVGAFLGNGVPGADEVYAVTLARPHLFRVSNKYVSFLEESPDAFRDPVLLPFGLKDVDSVAVEPDGKPSRGYGRSTITREERDMLGNWILLEAGGFVRAGNRELGRRGFVPPRGRMIWLTRGDTLAVVDVGRASGEWRALRVLHDGRNRDQEIFLVKEADAGPLWRRLAGLGAP